MQAPQVAPLPKKPGHKASAHHYKAHKTSLHRSAKGYRTSLNTKRPVGTKTSRKSARKIATPS